MCNSIISCQQRLILLCSFVFSVSCLPQNKTDQRSQIIPNSEITPERIHGGNEVGNGGDGILCNDGLMVLDAYEAIELRSINLLSVDQESNYIEHAKLIIDRFSTIDPARFELYTKGLSDFESNANFRDNVSLVDIPDSDHLVVPGGCRLVQIIVQKKPVFPEDKLFTIDKQLWDQLDPLNKSILALHEIIYKEAIELGQINSIGVRYFSAFLHAEKKLTDGKYKQTLESVNLPLTVNSLPFLASSLEFYPSGKLNGGVLFHNSEIEVYADFRFPLKSKSKVTFYESGELKSAWKQLVWVDNLWFKRDDRTFQASLSSLRNSEIIFDEEGYCLSHPSP